MVLLGLLHECTFQCVSHESPKVLGTLQQGALLVPKEKRRHAGPCKDQAKPCDACNCCSFLLLAKTLIGKRPVRSRLGQGMAAIDRGKSGLPGVP